MSRRRHTPLRVFLLVEPVTVEDVLAVIDRIEVSLKPIYRGERQVGDSLICRVYIGENFDAFTAACYDDARNRRTTIEQTIDNALALYVESINAGDPNPRIQRAADKIREYRGRLVDE